MSDRPSLDPDDLFRRGIRRLDEDEATGDPETKVVRTGFHVYLQDGKVYLSFEHPVEFLELTGQEAIRLAKAIHERGQRALRKTGGRSPRA